MPQTSPGRIFIINIRLSAVAPLCSGMCKKSGSVWCMYMSTRTINGKESTSVAPLKTKPAVGGRNVGGGAVQR